VSLRGRKTPGGATIRNGGHAATAAGEVWTTTASYPPRRLRKRARARPRPYAGAMALTTVEARQQLLDTLVEAADAIAGALASLGVAYEQLDQHTADRLEEQLFQPLQQALGRAKRTHAAFASRHGLDGHAFEAQQPGLASLRAKGLIERAIEDISRADGTLATLQDSPLPVEYGDVEVRKGLAEVRELIDGFGHRARDLLRTLGR
jgi:hypothetical protein